MFQFKTLVSGLSLALCVFLFTACGGYTLEGAKKALTDAGCTVAVEQKSNLPTTFEDHLDKIKAAYKVSKGTATNVYLAEFNTAQDAADIFADLASNKQRAGPVVMFTVADVTEGDTKVIWDAFAKYFNDNK